MNDYDKIMLIFMIIVSGYFLITEHLICKIERIERKNNLLEEENDNLKRIK